MKSDLGTQVEGKKVFERLIRFAEQKNNFEGCGSFSDCFYVKEKIDSGDMTSNQAHTYVTLICERYPQACELNQIVH